MSLVLDIQHPEKRGKRQRIVSPRTTGRDSVDPELQYFQFTDSKLDEFRNAAEIEHLSSIEPRQEDINPWRLARGVLQPELNHLLRLGIWVT